MMNIHGLHHIAIICSNYETSKKFYTEILGFSILNETFREERSSMKLDLIHQNNIQIELFSFPNSPFQDFFRCFISCKNQMKDAYFAFSSSQLP